MRSQHCYQRSREMLPATGKLYVPRMAIPGTWYKYRRFCQRSRNAGSSLTKGTRSTLKLITIIIRLPIGKLEGLV